MWAGIVPRTAPPRAEPVGRWPAAEDTDATDAGPADPQRTEAPRSQPYAPGDGRGTSAAIGSATGFEDIRDELDARAGPEQPAELSAGDLDDEHYEPPPPPPLPGTDKIGRLAWVGLVGGPLFLVLSALLDWDKGGLPSLLAVFATIGGFVTLIARKDDDRDPGDDGAVV